MNYNAAMTTPVQKYGSKRVHFPLSYDNYPKYVQQAPQD